MLDAAGIDDLRAQAGQEELSHRVLIAVRDRQVGQVGFVFQAQRAHQLERAGAVGQDATVRQHDPARRAAGAGRVDQAGQRRCRNKGGFRHDVVGRLRVPDQVEPGHDPHCAGVPLSAGIDRDQQVKATGFSRASQHPVGQRVRRHNRRACPGVAQQVRLIIDRIGGVGRDRHGADGHQRHFGDRKLRPVFHAQQYPITRRDARRAQMSGAGRGHAAELAPGNRMPRPAPAMPAASACPARHGPGRTSSRPGSAMSGSSARILRCRGGSSGRPFDVCFS